MKLNKRLGTTQFSVLESLIEHKGWYANCGWIWDNYSGTVRLMEGLVRHGLARKVGKAFNRGVLDAYEATEDGKEYAKQFGQHYRDKQHARW